MVAKLGLGTAQFGMKYGISNRDGQCPPDEVRNILSLASKQSVQLIDTAPSYGKSEMVLGKNLPLSHEFQIVTKTPVFSRQSLGFTEARELGKTFLRSLAKMRLPAIYGLLVHHADQLLAKGGSALFEEMATLKARGLVRKIGASVYTSEQIKRLCDRYIIDLIQVPVNIFDQRLIAGGQLENLQEAGIEVHVRSVFLQGLVLMEPERAPAYFNPIKSRMKDFHAAASALDTTPMGLALNYIRQQANIDYMIIGVCTARELREVLAVLDDEPRSDFDYERFAIDDDRMINPANWR